MSETSQPIQVLDVFNKQNFHTGVASEFVKFPKAQSTVTMPNGVKFGDGSFQNSASAGSSLTVKETDSNPNVSNVDTIIVSGGTLVNNNDGSVTITTGGAGASSLLVSDYTSSVAGASTINVEGATLIENGAIANLYMGVSKIHENTATYGSPLSSHQFLVDPFNITNVTTSLVTSSGSVSNYTGTYERVNPKATVKTNSSGIRHFQFDGNDDYIDFATSNNLIDAVPSTGSTSLWAWFDLEDTALAVNSLLSTRTRVTGSTDKIGAGLELKTKSGFYSFRVGKTSTQGFVEHESSVAVTKGWHMFAATMTYNSATVNYDYVLYLDGVSIHTFSDEYAAPASGVRIGAAITDTTNVPSASVTTALIGHCGITDSALSSTDITSIYNELKPYYLTSGLFAGDLTGNVTGNLTGNVTGDLTGNVSGNAGTVTNGVYTNTSAAISGTVTATEFLGPLTGDVTGNVTGEIQTQTSYGTTPSISGSTLTLTTAGNTYETFDLPYTDAGATVSTLAFSGTQRNNSQYVVCIYNNGSGDISFPTTISGVKVNHTSQVDVAYPAYAILTIFYKNSTNIFASVSVFS